VADPKTKRSVRSVAEFLNAMDHPQRKADCKVLAAMMRRATGAKPAMWGRVSLVLVATITSTRMAVQAADFCAASRHANKH